MPNTSLDDHFIFGKVALLLLLRFIYLCWQISMSKLVARVVRFRLKVKVVFKLKFKTWFKVKIIRARSQPRSNAIRTRSSRNFKTLFGL